MKASNPFHNQHWLIALSLIAAAVMVPMLAAGMTAWAEDDNPQRAAVTGLSATPGTDPGENFRSASDTDWNANTTATSPTITQTSDRTTLEALYQDTDGSNWSNSDNWLSGEPLGEWFGVTTNADGQVTHLSLRKTV